MNMSRMTYLYTNSILLYMLGYIIHVRSYCTCYYTCWVVLLMSKETYSNRKTYPKRPNVYVWKIAPSHVVHVKRDMSMLDLKKSQTKEVWKETYKSTTKEFYLKKRPAKETWVCDVKKRPFSRRDLQRTPHTTRASLTDKTETSKRDLQKKCKETYKSTTDLRKSPMTEPWTLQGPLSYRLDLDFKKRPTQEIWKTGLQKYYRPEKEPDERSLDTARASLVPTRLRLEKVNYQRTLKNRPTKVS